jgi:uncharacterized protein YciI
MKFFLLDADIDDEHQKDPLFETALDNHLKYLKQGFAGGRILFSGPKANGGGGVALMKAEDADEVNAYCGNDPFVQAGIQTYRITEFKIFDCLEGVRAYFDKT